MKNLYGIFLMLLVLLFASCAHQNVKPTTDIGKTTTTAQKVYGNPSLEQDYLVFEDEAHFWQFVAKGRETSENRKKWEKSLGFTSMRTNFEALSDISEKAGESGTGYGMSLDALAEKYKDIAVFEREGIFHLNCFYHPMAAVINNKGIVLIGNKLCKVDADKMLSVQNKDMDKLMANANIIESKNGVTVEMTKSKLENTRQICNSSYVFNGLTYVFGTVYYPPNSSNCKTEFNVYMMQNGNFAHNVDYYYTIDNWQKTLGLWTRKAFTVTVDMDGTIDNGNGTIFTHDGNMSVSQKDWDVAFANNLVSPYTNPVPPTLYSQAWISACFTGSISITFPCGQAKTWSY